MYPKDTKKLKCMVATVWILDCLHSAMVCIANWQNLISSFGNFEGLDNITCESDEVIIVPGIWVQSIFSKATVALTAMTTFLVHCFFCFRIHTLSRSNWIITMPLLVLALTRLAAASVSTGEMLRLKSFSDFVKQFNCVFTLGLATSTSLDVLITGILCYYLRQRKSGLARMDQIIDILTLYTVENGMLTCITTAVSLVCWLTMPDNLIFLGLHLAINKLYANSIMASLNARRSLSHRSQGTVGEEGYPMPVLLPSGYGARRDGTVWSSRGAAPRAPKSRVQVNINIEQTVHHEGFGELQEEGLPYRSSGDEVKLE
ncbi:hypothetical protein C8Q79DRAFT_324129 [Trametes meyenii]|nr:hypothetical protein C8Q79DRAFT_324129 [Trametes meyenii]